MYDFLSTRRHLRDVAFLGGQEFWSGDGPDGCARCIKLPVVIRSEGEWASSATLARSLARPFLRIHSLNLFSLLLFSLSSSSTLGRSSDPHQLGRKVVLVVARAAQAPLGQRDRLVLPVPVDAAGRRSPSPVRVAVPVPAAAAAAARGRGLAAARGPLLGLGDPGVDEDVLGGESLVGVLAEEAADEAARARRDRVGQAELAAPDLGEEALVLLPVEGVSAMQRKGRCQTTCPRDMDCLHWI